MFFYHTLALWPVTSIDTAALNLIDKVAARKSRTPEIMGDAAHLILTKNSTGFR